MTSNQKKKGDKNESLVDLLLNLLAKEEKVSQDDVQKERSNQSQVISHRRLDRQHLRPVQNVDQGKSLGFDRQVPKSFLQDGAKNQNQNQNQNQRPNQNRELRPDRNQNQGSKANLNSNQDQVQRQRSNQNQNQRPNWNQGPRPNSNQDQVQRQRSNQNQNQRPNWNQGSRPNWNQGPRPYWNQNKGQRDKPKGSFFFSPEIVGGQWSKKCKYRKPNVLFLKSWVWCWGKQVEIHCLSYMNYRFPELVNKEWTWQKWVSRLPDKYSEKIVDKYVENYERMMRSRRFPEWEKKQKKKAKKHSYLKTTPLKKEWFGSFLEKRLNKACFGELERNLRRLFFHPGEKVKFVYHYVRSPWISSTLCARYFWWRLKQKRCHFQSMIRRFLMHTNFYGGEKHNLYGIYVSGAGRFTRRQRASSVKLQRGRVPFSTVEVPLDYTGLSLPLKYGACSIRVWVCHLRKEG